MTVEKKGSYYYGDTITDLQNEIKRYSKLNGYTAEHFQSSKCECSSEAFNFYTDDDEGVAIRKCVDCDKEHLMGDSADFIKDATDIGQHECVCGNEAFKICTGVSLYEDSKDIRWVYFGLKCDKCNLIGTFADWKSEFIGFNKFLSKS